MKNAVFLLLLLLFFGQNNYAQIKLQDFWKDNISVQKYNGCDTTALEFDQDTCNQSILNLSGASYQSATNLVTEEAFDHHVLKNFQYTIAGEDKAANGVTVELASPKATISGIHKLGGSTLLKYSLYGGLNDDDRTAPIFTGDKFNTAFGFSIGLAKVICGNSAKYIIDDNLKKNFHWKVVHAVNNLYPRGDTLVKLRRWMIQVTGDQIMSPAEQADPVYDYFTKQLTGFVGAFTNFLQSKSTASRIALISQDSYDQMLQRFADIDNKKAVQKESTVTPLGGRSFYANFKFLEDPIIELEDSMAKPYWTRDKLTWISGDIGIKNALLNVLSSVSDSTGTSGNPYHDLQVTISINQLKTDLVNKSKFFYWRVAAGLSRGYNARFLDTRKIEKDEYYITKPEQLTSFISAVEVYGNLFRAGGLPGFHLMIKPEYSTSFPNPWVIALEGGLLFNLQDKKSNNFLFIMPSVGFTDIAMPGIDVSKNFSWNIKFGIPINVKYK